MTTTHARLKRPSLLADCARKPLWQIQNGSVSQAEQKGMSMRRIQLLLLWLVSFSSFCFENTSQGASMATNVTSGPQGLCEVRTTAYSRSRHGTAKNANGSQLKAGYLKSAAADWSRFPLGTKFNVCGTHQTYVVDDYGPALVGTNKSTSTWDHSERCIIGAFARSRSISLNQARMRGVLHCSNHESACRTYEGWSKS